jgi:hypothetical protein
MFRSLLRIYTPRCPFITWFIQCDTIVVLIHGWIALQSTFLRYSLRCPFITWFIRYDTIVAVIHGWIMLQTKGKCRAGHCPVKWLWQVSMVENYECNFSPFGRAMHGVGLVRASSYELRILLNFCYHLPL